MDKQPYLSIVLILCVAGAIAWAGSQGSAMAVGLPLFGLCALVSFGVNWVAFVHAYRFQTEHYFDLTGSLTYLTLVLVALTLGEAPDLRSLLLGLFIAVWATRLGTFLFKRIKEDGSDGRFDELKPSFPRFLMTWTLQGLWVFLTMSCALAAMTGASREPALSLTLLGAALWVLGFGIEVAADRQKRAFRADPANEGRFITTGLWAWSRHPNYFGEITLWGGIAIMALPAISGWQYATLISPLFVYVLLSRISGVPLLESRAKKRWGDDPEFRAYKACTPALMLRPPSRRSEP